MSKVRRLLLMAGVLVVGATEASAALVLRSQYNLNGDLTAVVDLVKDPHVGFVVDLVKDPRTTL